MARTLPATATKASGQLITGALWNAGPYALSKFLLAPPVFRARQQTAVAFPSGSWVSAQFDTIDMDSDSGWSNANLSNYYAQVPGWYWVEGYMAWGNGGGATGRFEAVITKNGTDVPGSAQFSLMYADLMSIGAGTLVQLAVGDYVQILGRQNTGNTVNTFGGSDLCPCLNVFWVHS